MAYRDDLNAAMMRIVSLERENTRLKQRSIPSTIQASAAVKAPIRDEDQGYIIVLGMFGIPVITVLLLVLMACIAG